MIRMVNTGTKCGYKNYHGDIYNDKKKIGSWDYDKNQNLMIALVIGKRFYSRTVKGLEDKINKWGGKI